MWLLFGQLVLSRYPRNSILKRKIPADREFFQKEHGLFKSSILQENFTRNTNLFLDVPREKTGDDSGLVITMKKPSVANGEVIRISSIDFTSLRYHFLIISCQSVSRFITSGGFCAFEEEISCYLPPSPPTHFPRWKLTFRAFPQISGDIRRNVPRRADRRDRDGQKYRRPNDRRSRDTRRRRWRFRSTRWVGNFLRGFPSNFKASFSLVEFSREFWKLSGDLLTRDFRLFHNFSGLTNQVASVYSLRFVFSSLEIPCMTLQNWRWGARAFVEYNWIK